MRQALEEMLQLRLSSSALPSDSTDHVADEDEVALPDLLPTMEPGFRDASWVMQVHRRLEALSHSLSIRLLACEYEPGPVGFLCIAATSPTIADEVVRGDRVQAGLAALRDGDRPVRISQRIFRLVCANGSLVSVHEGSAEELDEASIEAAVNRSFDPGEFRRHVQMLREAAQLEVPDPQQMLDELGRLFRNGTRAESILDAISRRIKRRLGEEGGALTLWQFANAATEVARDLPEWPDRLDLEEAAGSLARLHPPLPRLSPAIALTPAGS